MLNKLKKLKKLLNNSTFLFFMNVVIAETALTATFVYFYQIPSDAILTTNLTEVLMIFEG